VLPHTTRIRPGRSPSCAARAQSRQSATWLRSFHDMPRIQAQLSPTRNGPSAIAPASIYSFPPSCLLAKIPPSPASRILHGARIRIRSRGHVKSSVR
jgi:hypothetical protein